jgi:hypothetical protein
MDLEKDALKNRLLELAKKEAIKFGADMGKEIKKNIKLEKNSQEKWMKIVYIGEKVKRTPINKESFEILLAELFPDRELPAFTIVDEKDSIKFQFEEEEVMEKVFDHYTNFFFGNMQQQVVESYLTKYISELLDEGCATGTCGCSDHSCSIPEDHDTHSNEN